MENLNPNEDRREEAEKVILVVQDDRFCKATVFSYTNMFS